MSEKKSRPFELITEMRPSGDQPKAISHLVENYAQKVKHQTLLGVTGSGKTFTMANVIQKMKLPTLVMAPNKTLAAQMYEEFKELFPNNAVEYFVSYYDYYQPEAYLPATDTYIEKDSAINEQIDRMRHSATRSLLERSDVIIVSSVSCIYGLGSPDAYKEMTLAIKSNEKMKRDQLLRELIRVQYQRNDVDFSRGKFRVRGDVVEIYPAYEEDRVVRVEFFGDFIDRISWVDSLRRNVLESIDEITIYPASHYVNTEERFKTAIKAIQDELRERLQELRAQNKLVEAQRLEQRTYYDIEMMEEMGFCSGIENYSRHFTGQLPGQPPPTLIEYFPAEFLTIIDESHVTVPQIGGMYRGDRARKTTLVEHGFRLPSALDNRPLNFQEFEGLMDNVMYVSATPGEYEFKKSEGVVVEQIIRPTGLIDPIVTVKPATYQVDDLLKEVREVVKRNERVLVTTLTKRSAEDLTEYYQSVGVKVKYLHSDIDTLERTDILRDLRLGVFDVLVGINLLREGLDLPEVSLVAITDADKEGFLRSTRSLIQTIGRAARNAEGRVILYADTVTQSMKAAMDETARRRELQGLYNKENGITPATIKKTIKKGLSALLEEGNPILRQEGRDKKVLDKYKNVVVLNKEIVDLKKKMKKAAEQLEFELAAEYRDEIKRLEMIDLKFGAGITSEDGKASNGE